MPRKLLAGIALLSAFAASASAFGQSCDAYFKFDGNLSDSSGNGHDGTMIGTKGTPASPAFSAGVDGQALHVDGTSAMRTYLDLNYESCPKVTVAGWIRVDSIDVRSTQYILSTGGGSGPGLRSSGTTAVLTGTGNGLIYQKALRDERAWFFFAGVYDYEAGTYRFHWRDRIFEGKLSGSRRPPEDAFWVGAYNDSVNYASEGAHIDELRVIGKTLTPEEIRELRGGRPGAIVSLGRQAGLGTSIPQAAPGISGQLPTTIRDIDPDALPPRPLEILGSSQTDTKSDTPLLETPEGLGAGREGTVDPDLTMPEGGPAQELQDQLQTIAENPPPPGPPNEEIVCDTPGTPRLRGTIAGNFPADFLSALAQARECGDKVTVASLNGNDQWIVSTPDQIAWSDNVPSALAAKLAEFENNHGGLDAADIAEAGAWVIVSGSAFAEAGLPANAVARLQVMSRNGLAAASFDFHPQDNSRWVMVDASGLITGDGLVPSMVRERPYFQVSKRVPHFVTYTPDGSWVMVGNDLWFSTDDVRGTVISDMSAIRRQGRRIDSVVFNDNQGDYMILSSGAEPARSSDPIYVLEQGMAGSNIWARMFNHKLRSVSVAVVRNNAIAWARGYGIRNKNDVESWVRPDTTFDAASISKPIAAFGIMQLVDDGKIDLQREGVLQDIEPLISSINRPGFRDRVRPEASNLIQVLQHCASICYDYTPDCANLNGSGGGAGAYSTTANLPSLSQMIRGSGPAKSTHRLIRTGNGGVRHEYTSANYMLVQALIEVHGGGFLNHMGTLLSDLGMDHSTYETPYPGRNGNFARGHSDTDVMPVYAYPEMAAASLVTRPIDVAKFVIAINRDGAGLLSQANFDHYLGRKATVRVFCNEPGTMALGIRHQVSDDDWKNRETFYHGGSHNGYRTRMFGIPGEQSGVVVFMTGTKNGAADFFDEFRRAFLAAYLP